MGFNFEKIGKEYNKPYVIQYAEKLVDEFKAVVNMAYGNVGQTPARTPEEGILCSQIVKILVEDRQKLQNILSGPITNTVKINEDKSKSFESLSIDFTTRLMNMLTEASNVSISHIKIITDIHRASKSPFTEHIELNAEEKYAWLNFQAMQLLSRLISELNVKIR